MRQQEQEYEFMGDMRRNLNIALWACQIIAAPADVWLRRLGTWGDRHASFRMVSGVFAIFLVPLFAPRDDPRPLVVMFLLTIVMLVFHRIKGWQLRRQGYDCHSRYVGDSLFCPFPSKSEAKAKTVWEPVALFAVGGLLLAISPALGGYVMVVAVCHSFIQSWMEQEEVSKQRRYRDAMFEAGMIGGRRGG